MNVERLIERLQNRAAMILGGPAQITKTLEEAAAALAKLQAENEALVNSVDGLSFLNAKLQAERDEAREALEVCRESLVDQAAARADPTMPLLVASVRERLEGESEAVYAMSESREDRIYAHGLSLLCDWQKAAASRALGGGE